jgi:hypothetical protein
VSVEIVSDDNADVFICTTTETAFGPAMETGSGEFFLEWLTDDPRSYGIDRLKELYNTWYDEVYMQEGEEDTGD